jgi:hypothetical protein
MKKGVKNLKTRLLPIFAVALLLFSAISALLLQNSAFAAGSASQAAKAYLVRRAISDCVGFAGDTISTGGWKGANTYQDIVVDGNIFQPMMSVDFTLSAYEESIFSGVGLDTKTHTVFSAPGNYYHNMCKKGDIKKYFSAMGKSWDEDTLVSNNIIRYTSARDGGVAQDQEVSINTANLNGFFNTIVNQVSREELRLYLFKQDDQQCTGKSDAFSVLTSYDHSYKTCAEMAQSISSVEGDIEHNAKVDAISSILSGTGNGFNLFQQKCLDEIGWSDKTPEQQQEYRSSSGIPSGQNPAIFYLNKIREANGTPANPSGMLPAGAAGPTIPGTYAGVCASAFNAAATQSLEENLPDVDSDTGASVSNCYNYFDIQSQSWVICPTLTNLSGVGKSIYDKLKELLAVDATMFDINDSDNPIYRIWNVFRNISNIGFSIFLLLIIFSQITGFGVNNYGVKKMLPKLIIAAVLVNLSWIITVLAIDISNILGYQLHNLIINITLGDASASVNTGADVFGGILAVLGDGALGVTQVVPIVAAFTSGGGWGAAFAIAMVLIPAIIAVVIFFLTLGLRQLIIIFCVIAAPIAFLLYSFPNTNSLFKKYIKLFQAALVIYPVCSALYGISQIIQYISAEVSSGPIAIVAAIAPFLPFAIAPTLVTKSVSALGAVGGKISQFGKTLGNQAKSGIDNFQKNDTGKSLINKSNEFSRRRLLYDKKALRSAKKKWRGIDKDKRGSFNDYVTNNAVDLKQEELSNSQEKRLGIAGQSIDQYKSDLTKRGQVARYYRQQAGHLGLDQLVSEAQQSVGNGGSTDTGITTNEPTDKIFQAMRNLIESGGKAGAKEAARLMDLLSDQDAKKASELATMLNNDSRNNEVLSKNLVLGGTDFADYVSNAGKKREILANGTLSEYATDASMSDFRQMSQQVEDSTGKKFSVNASADKAKDLVGMSDAELMRRLNSNEKGMKAAFSQLAYSNDQNVISWANQSPRIVEMMFDANATPLKSDMAKAGLYSGGKSMTVFSEMQRASTYAAEHPEETRKLETRYNDARNAIDPIAMSKTEHPTYYKDNGELTQQGQLAQDISNRIAAMRATNNNQAGNKEEIVNGYLAARGIDPSYVQNNQETQETYKKALSIAGEIIDSTSQQPSSEETP